MDYNIREDDANNLKSQIEELNNQISAEKDKLAILEEKSKYVYQSDIRCFSSGVTDSETHVKTLGDLHAKVSEVYKKCIGEGDSRLSTVQLLAAIEKKLENLFDSIEGFPSDIITQAEHVIDLFLW